MTRRRVGKIRIAIFSATRFSLGCYLRPTRDAKYSTSLSGRLVKMGEPFLNENVAQSNYPVVSHCQLKLKLMQIALFS